LFKSQRFYRNVLVDFVDCKRGEIFDLNSQTQSSCSRCVDGYSLNDNIDFKSVALKCLPCPPHALKCYDDQVFLSKGTWRPGIQNYHIYDCQSKYACLGGNKTGQQGCNVGHYGPICGICEHNKYFLSSKKICDLCDTRLVSNVLSVVFILIFASLCAYFFTKFSTIIYRYYDQFVSTFVTNFVSTYQIISLGAGASTAFEAFQSTSKTTSSAKILNLDFTTVFSLSCYFDTNYYSLVEFNTLFPIVIIGPLYISSLFIKSDKVRRKIFSAIVSVLYFVLPSVSALIFKIFKCIEVESKSYLVADLTIECSGKDYEYYTKWVYASILLYPIGIPLFFLYSLYIRRHIVTNIDIIMKCKRTVNHPNMINLDLSPQYELLEPLESLYLPYKYWWFDTIETLARLCLTSLIRTLIPDEHLIIVLSVLLSLLSYFIQYRFSPYRDKLQNKVADILKLQILLIYFAVYIILNDGLSFPDDVRFNYGFYRALDLSLVLLCVIVLIMGLRYLFQHIAVLRVNLAAIQPAEVLTMKDTLYRDVFRESSILDVQGNTPLKDLLRVQGILFLRLSPLGTYECLKKQCSDIGNYVNAMHVMYKIPVTFCYDSTSNTKGDITIYALRRSLGENRLKIFFKAGLPSLSVNTKIALISDLYDREASLQLVKSDKDESPSANKQIMPEPLHANDTSGLGRDQGTVKNANYIVTMPILANSRERIQTMDIKELLEICDPGGDNFSMTSSMMDEEYELAMQQDPFYKRDTVTPHAALAFNESAGTQNINRSNSDDELLFRLSGSSSGSERGLGLGLVSRVDIIKNIKQDDRDCNGNEQNDTVYDGIKHQGAGIQKVNRSNSDDELLFRLSGSSSGSERGLGLVSRVNIIKRSKQDDRDYDGNADGLFQLSDDDDGGVGGSGSGDGKINKMAGTTIDILAKMETLAINKSYSNVATRFEKDFDSGNSDGDADDDKN